MGTGSKGNEDRFGKGMAIGSERETDRNEPDRPSKKGRERGSSMEPRRWDPHTPPRIQDDKVRTWHNAEQTMVDTHEEPRGKHQDAHQSERNDRQAIVLGKARNNPHANPGDGKFTHSCPIAYLMAANPAS